MPEATVMLTGASGTGKSTLGNFLLHGRPDDGFSAAAGKDAVTTRCEAREDRSQNGSTFKVIDTPGTPATSWGTEAYLSAIRHGARKAGRLNALVLVIEYSQNRRYRISDMENAAGLLKQFNKLGCKIFIACRVPGHLPGKNKERIRNTEQSWEAFVAEIVDRAGLDNDVSTYLLAAADMASQAREMRSNIMGCPLVEIPSRSGMTFFDRHKRRWG